MFVKKFEAESLEQALSLVKTELGPNALILSTQNRKGKWFQKPSVEVTAAFDSKAAGDPLPETPPESFSEDELARVFPHRKRRTVIDDEGEPNVSKQGTSRYADFSSHSSKPKSENLELMWTRLGFSPESAEELARRLKFDYPKKDLSNPAFLDKARARLVTPVLNTLSSAILNQRAHWTLVGAPGCGKTSLCVKLALHAKAEGSRVALLSCDKFKLLGKKELAAYAKLIQVSFYGESQTFKKEDCSFADSPAFPMAGTEKAVERWAEIEAVCRDRSVIVVLDASARLNELVRQVDQAKVRLNVTGLAFTRLDIIAHYGIVHDVLKATKVPLLGASLSQSYKTAFKFFENSELCSLILRGRPLSEEPFV